jgi:hypothetical protein
MIMTVAQREHGFESGSSFDRCGAAGAAAALFDTATRTGNLAPVNLRGLVRAVALTAGLAGAGLLFAGCTRRSAFPEGRDPVVRASLPETFPVDVLEKADRLDLLALDEEGAFPEHLRGWPRASIRAVVQVDAPALRERVIRSLYRGVRDAKMALLCFHPHHAIRARRAGVEIEIAICLHCANFMVRDAGGHDAAVAIHPTELMALFDEVFATRGIRFDVNPDIYGRWVPKP